MIEFCISPATERPPLLNFTWEHWQTMNMWSNANNRESWKEAVVQLFKCEMLISSTCFEELPKELKSWRCFLTRNICEDKVALLRTRRFTFLSICRCQKSGASGVWNEKLPWKDVKCIKLCCHSLQPVTVAHYREPGHVWLRALSSRFFPATAIKYNDKGSTITILQLPW